MEKMRLDFDVLSVVMSHMLRRPDILSVMRTCKTVYAAGIPALLKRNVVFTKQQKLESFCDFILVDAPTRGKHIQGLEFFPSVGEIKDDGLVEKIVRVLKHASDLKRLVFQAAENFVASNAKIAQAFASLKGVKELRIQDGGAEIVKMLKTMQSPVEEINLNIQGMCGADLNPVSSLSQFQPSLFADETSSIPLLRIKPHSFPLARSAKQCSLKVGTTYIHLLVFEPPIPYYSEVSIHSMERGN